MATFWAVVDTFWATLGKKYGLHLILTSGRIDYYVAIEAVQVHLMKDIKLKLPPFHNLVTITSIA